jgi:hypothetical protein
VKLVKGLLQATAYAGLTLALLGGVALMLSEVDDPDAFELM